jgi:hypothetical protein
MFLYYENFGDENMRIHLVRMHLEGDQLTFEDEIIPGIPKKNKKQ